MKDLLGLALAFSLLPASGVSAREAEAAAPPTISAPSQATASIIAPVLRIVDIDRSVRFYTLGLGMVELGRHELPNAIEIIVAFTPDRGDTGIMLLKRRSEEAAEPVVLGDAYLRTVLRVPDVAAAKAHLAAAGYPTEPIVSFGPHRILNASDPDGHRYELVQYPEEGNHAPD